jgi:hypothetical protein
MFTIGKGFEHWVIIVLALTAPLPFRPVAAEAPSQISVGQLLTDGWEIAGYASSAAMYGSLILFKHKDRNYFVQCSVVYDATRSPRASERVVTNCYEVR